MSEHHHDSVERHVSTGRLPGRERVQSLLDEAHLRFADDRDGEVSAVYPALAAVPPDGFGLCVASVDGGIATSGDAETAFTIMSVAKPFVFAVVCDLMGPEQVRERIGVNATGLPFNSVVAVDRAPGGRTNPMVNSGAIVTASLIPGDSVDQQWAELCGRLSAFAGRELELDEDVAASALATNHRNRAIARLLYDAGALTMVPEEAVELYTMQSCLRVSAVDLAVMGATLADAGVNPRTDERVIGPGACRSTLAVMATAGLYETSGEWLYDIGLPGKSGIGGGIVMVSPGKGALGTYAPRLDAAGNSVKGQRAARLLSGRLGLDLFASSVFGADDTDE
ncbi:MAG TPA: glutaminase A [Microthrixaceae bacterium]|nr:glutaminase A [Microthrixaceae bacterium]